jgi:hypothetical protein
MVSEPIAVFQTWMARPLHSEEIGVRLFSANASGGALSE